jgi:hypothetical protein
MKLIISQDEFDNAGSRELISIECSVCHQPFKRKKHYVQAGIKANREVTCSPVCKYNQKRKPRQDIPCKQCGVTISCLEAELIKHTKRRYNNHFCSRRCKGIYGAAHRTTGANRSKLEQWLEIHLKTMYPMLNIKFNDTSAIGAELDIYLPTLQLAFELNGPFHYEPIFGQDKLEKTQQRDKMKFHLCSASSIDLCVIDTTQHPYFKEKYGQVFLDIITKIINERIGSVEDLHL